MSKFLSGIIMVAGTSIGAAMIAMPLSAAKVGFLQSILLLILIAYVMYNVACITIDIYQVTNSSSTIAKIAGQILNKPSQYITSIAILLLLFSLMVAYISGVGEILATTFNCEYHLIIYTIVTVLILSLSISDKIFDYYNKIAFGLKIVFIIIMTSILIQHISLQNIINSSTVTYEISMLSVMPVFVTSLGFHAGIPFIYKFLDQNISLCKKAILYGIITTIVLYMLWLSLTFGVIQHNDLFNVNGSLSSFIKLLNINSNLLYSSIDFFILFAILTSLFGVATSLFDFILEYFQDTFNTSNRLLISLLTFIPPCIFCILNKSLFLNALNLAGCMLTIIAIIIPILIQIKLKNTSALKLNNTSFFNHQITLIICLLVGIITILSEVLMTIYS